MESCCVVFRMELSCVRYLQDKIELCQSLRGRIKLCRISLGWNRVVSNFFSLESIFSGGMVLCKIFSGRNEFLIRVEWRKTEALIDSQQKVMVESVRNWIIINDKSGFSHFTHLCNTTGI